ncbi:MAG: 4-hydroxyproline epimerase [Pseudomonadota bacterium]
MREVFECIDAHTCGNPVRVVVDNAPELAGPSMQDKRQHFLREFDWIRTGLMFEPRGHDAMSGSILYPPTTEDGDLGVLFIEVSGCLPMCGHGTIGTVTVALQEGLVKPREEGLLRLDTPAGRVEARYVRNGTVVESVTLTNVPAYLHAKELNVQSEELGSVVVDIAYGGNFYAIVEPQENYSGLEQLSADDIRRLSPMLRRTINDQFEVVHQTDPQIRGVSHVMWTGEPRDAGAHARNAVFYGERGIDRSPCGTGTSARMAQRYADHRLQLGEPFVHESIIGSLFHGRLLSTVNLGSVQGVIPEISGWARITGYNRIVIDDFDPYHRGFILT